MATKLMGFCNDNSTDVGVVIKQIRLSDGNLADQIQEW